MERLDVGDWMHGLMYDCSMAVNRGTTILSSQSLDSWSVGQRRSKVRVARQPPRVFVEAVNGRNNTKLIRSRPDSPQ